jgi:hypothetical protein
MQADSRTSAHTPFAASSGYVRLFGSARLPALGQAQQGRATQLMESSEAQGHAAEGLADGTTAKAHEPMLGAQKQQEALVEVPAATLELEPISPPARTDAGSQDTDPAFSESEAAARGVPPVQSMQDPEGSSQDTAVPATRPDGACSDGDDAAGSHRAAAQAAHGSPTLHDAFEAPTSGLPQPASSSPPSTAPTGECSSDSLVEPRCPSSPALDVDPHPVAAPVAQELEVELHVRDGGLGLLLALLPPEAAAEWGGGSAAVDLRLTGPLAAPRVEGRARVARGAVSSPLLRSPLSGLAADLEVRRVLGPGVHVRAVRM